MSEDIVVSDRRLKFGNENGDADLPAQPVEGAPVEVEFAEPLTPEEEKTLPKAPPVLHVPSPVDGDTIKFTVGELFPWRGVFFLVADVKDKPAPHAIIVPIDHTGAHKKLAARRQQRIQQAWKEQAIKRGAK